MLRWQEILLDGARLRYLPLCPERIISRFRFERVPLINFSWRKINPRSPPVISLDHVGGQVYNIPSWEFRDGEAENRKSGLAPGKCKFGLRAANVVAVSLDLRRHARRCDMSKDWLSSDGEVVHPSAPRGGGGNGSFQSGRQFGAEVDDHRTPHPSSPLGRNAVFSPAQARVMQSREAKIKYNQLNAQAAVDYVKAKMTIGAGNKFGDIFETLGGSLVCIADEREASKDWQSLLQKDPDTGQVLFNDDYMRKVAALAEEKGCGNCGEQSATAFVYLLNRGSVPSIGCACKNPVTTIL